MTLPDERYRAVVQAQQLLQDLLDAKKTPRVPRVIRERAAAALRHYPSEWDLAQAEQHAPHVFQARMEPLYRMIKQHELADSVTEDYLEAGMIKDREGRPLDLSGI